MRVTLQALAAVLGGTQSLHTNSMDEALALPSAIAARTALRTQQIIAYESGVANTVDPTGGSYAIESMTDEIEAVASEYIRTIDTLGGMLRAIETGYVQREITESAYKLQKSIEAGETVVVGVNRFATDGPHRLELLAVDEAAAKSQRRALEKLRAERHSETVRCSLDRLQQSARGPENLLPHILDAVDALATVGEISDCLRSVFGEFHESIVG